MPKTNTVNSQSGDSVAEALQALLESFPDIAVIVHPDGRIINANRAFCENAGTRSTDGPDWNIYEFVSAAFSLPNLADHLKQTCDVVLTLEKSMTFEDDSESWKTSVNPVKSPSGEISSLFILLQDISEQKRKERQRQRERELDVLIDKTMLDQGLEASQIGIWKVDLGTRQHAWSKTFSQLFGIEQTDQPFDFARLSKTIHPDDLEKTRQSIHTAIIRGGKIEIEFRVCYPDGSVHWLVSRGKALPDREGSGEQYVGSLIDITERKKLEDELVESKIRLNQALEAARAGVWEWDLVSGQNVWSDDIWRLYGIERKDNVTPSLELWADSIHPDDLQMASGTITEAAEQQRELNVEYRVCHPDRSIHWLMARGKPLADHQGRTVRFIGTVIDITERRRAIEEMKKSQEKLDFVLSKCNIGIWDINLDNLKAERSQEHARIFGYQDTSRPWNFDTFISHILPEDRTRVKNIVQQSIEQEASSSFECRIRSVDGHERWIWVFGFFASKGIVDKSRHAYGIVQDITERKLTELLLQMSEQKFRNIFDCSPIAIYIRNFENGTVFEVNEAWLRLFDFTKEEVIDHTIPELGIFTHSEDIDKIAELLREQGRLSNRPFEMRKKSGTPIMALVSADLITIDNRTCLLVMMMDITIWEIQQANISQLEKVVTDQTMQLRMEVARLHQFLNMISHEYRTPLAIIRGSLDLIALKQKNGNYSLDQEMAKIKRAIDRLVEVMEVSIQESRLLESPKSAPEEAFRLETVISSQVKAFRSMWPERELRSTGTLADTMTFGETAHLKMALFNLLDNARKYSPPGTAIEIERHQEAKEAVIIIRNQGKFITKLEEEKLFEKYRRGTNTANTSGAGIGLWLVKNIIEQHQGKVSLKSTSGNVEAVVRLPLLERSQKTGPRT